MAVYTRVERDDAERFLADYELGKLRELKPIAEGVENSNYRLRAERGDFVLTLYERRVDPFDLPFFLDLMERAADAGTPPCPRPIRARDGKALRQLAGRPAALLSFLKGRGNLNPSDERCAALGDALAQFHTSLAAFEGRRVNSLGISAWRSLLSATRSELPALNPDAERLALNMLERAENRWPAQNALPRGVIHADLFPDNVLFADDQAAGLEVAGFIDFYFACFDFLLYDAAVCLNAWGFDADGEFVASRAKALLDGYRSRRDPDEAEREAFPTLCLGAALRFFSTRAYDWFNTPDDALVKRKDPMEYLRRLRFFETSPSAETLGLGGAKANAATSPSRQSRRGRVVIYTDGACSGNPGPGGWAAILLHGARRREIFGSEAETTNNRMELTAAIQALETLRTPCDATLRTDSKYVRDGATSWLDRWKRSNWRTAKGKPIANADLWRRLDEARSRHAVRWEWLRGHQGEAENERADELARSARDSAARDDPS